MSVAMRSRLAIAALSLLCATAAAAPPDHDAVELGRRIYMDGVLPSGEPLTAVVSGDVEISGEFVVCGECHRRSGLGASEGESVAPPVVGSLLYQPWQLPTSRPPAPPVIRPAYDRETLAQSIRQGISSTGETFSLLMPRYRLSDEDMGYLIAFLESLSADPDPGVSDTDIHFATIVSADVDPDARQAMLDVMQAFIEQKNSETRYESKRAASGPWHKDWMFKPYRKWVLHTWELDVDPAKWRAQLEKHYAAQPVFAVLNGIAGESWAPIHDFCHVNRLPCLFPTTDLPVVDREDFYTVYLSKAIALEAEAVAQRLRDQEIGSDEVTQVYVPGDAVSRRAAEELQRSLGNAAVTISAVDKCAGAAAAKALVLWLPPEGINACAEQLADPGSGPVYLSGSLLQGKEASIDSSLQRRVRVVYSTELPGDVDGLLMRSTGWLRFKRIYSPEHKAVQANAYFTMKMVGGALFAIHGFFNRDYFVEKIEHMIDNATYTSVYPRISLAPDQRFVAKGVRIARFDEQNPGELVSDVDWLVPE